MPATQMAARLGKTLQDSGTEVDGQSLTRGVGNHISRSVTFLWCRFWWAIEPVPDTAESEAYSVWDTQFVKQW